MSSSDRVIDIAARLMPHMEAYDYAASNDKDTLGHADRIMKAKQELTEAPSFYSKAEVHDGARLAGAIVAAYNGGIDA